MRLPFHLGRSSVRTTLDHAPEPVSQLTRDVFEAEEIAVSWLRARGFDDACRVGTNQPLGVRGAGVRAYVSFDPLPMELDVLDRIVTQAEESELPVSFSFAGWTPQAQAWAEHHDVPLIRFTFAGTTDPSNDAARQLGISGPA